MGVVHPALRAGNAPGAYRGGKRHVRHRLCLHVAHRAGGQYRTPGTGQLHDGGTPPVDGAGARDGRPGLRAGADPPLHAPGRGDQLRGLRAHRAGTDLLEHIEQGHPAGKDLARRFPAGQPHPDHPGAYGAGLPVPRGIPLRGGALRTQIFRPRTRPDGFRSHLLHALLHRLDPRKRREQEIPPLQGHKKSHLPRVAFLIAFIVTWVRTGGKPPSARP